VLDRSIVAKQEELLAADGGLARRPLEAADAEAPSLEPEQIRTLAEYGIRLEEHFHGPQDVEWVVDEGGQCWILQTRPLALVQATRSRAKTRVREAPLAEGGRTVYPGRVSGPAHPVESREGIAHTPAGAIVFVPRASPEIVQLFPRIAGLVAEWGNLAGHAAALLREFRVPSVFLMTGALERVRSGEPVSLDAGQAKVYPGTLWETRAVRATPTWARPDRFKDPINRRLLTLNLVDPAAGDFRPSGCRSAHDVLRFCHESAVEAMFAVNDVIGEDHSHASKEFRTPIPLNVSVLDLGGGVTPEAQDARAVTPEQVVSRPFRALWRGLSHAKVSWVRDMPATLGDLASVMAGWLTPQDQGIRTFGEKSYVLVADEYLNLNSRLAYHFTLVDACLSDNPGINYISFRFAGGGATRQRRTFRARFIEACLLHHGFRVDRRGDLVNAWFKKAPAEQTEANLDILGRLIASSTHLDMYMASPEVMKWYVRQFLAGNYSFRPEQAPPPAVE
jgi:pyruvate,water dikinase